MLILYLSLGGLAFAVLQSLVAPALPVLALEFPRKSNLHSYYPLIFI